MRVFLHLLDTQTFLSNDEMTLATNPPFHFFVERKNKQRTEISSSLSRFPTTAPPDQSETQSGFRFVRSSLIRSWPQKVPTVDIYTAVEAATCDNTTEMEKFR